INGEHYLVAGENLSYKEFVEFVAQRTGLSQRRLKIPGTLLSTVGRLGTWTGNITKRVVKLDYAAAYMLTLDNYYSGEKAARDLSIAYRPISTAIDDALTWFKNSGKIKMKF